MSLTVEDRTLEFLLRRDTNIAPPDLQSLHGTPFAVHHWRDALDGVQQDLRHSVWRCKSELDAIDGATYTATRNKLFPLAVGGTSTHRFTNRAGYKLMESMDSTGVWQHLTTTRKSRKRPHSVAFADVCGGPGSFSQALFSVARKYNTKLEGFGMTLAGVDGLDWYPELAKRSTFTATYGLDGKGDIFKLSNIEALASLTTRAGVALVVADGGFHVDFSVANYQETISARIMYGQWLAALKIHVTGGCFVLKLFDTFSPLTRAVLFLSTFLYDRVHIVKPKHSRIVNSERYLVCIGYRGMPAGWMQHLDRCYVEGFTKEDHVPDLISSAWMAQDTVFMHDLEEMNRVIAENQQSALRMIVEAAPAVKEEYEKRAAQEAAAPQPASTAIGGVSE